MRAGFFSEQGLHIQPGGTCGISWPQCNVLKDFWVKGSAFRGPRVLGLRIEGFRI